MTNFISLSLLWKSHRNFAHWYKRPFLCIYRRLLIFGAVLKVPLVNLRTSAYLRRPEMHFLVFGGCVLSLSLRFCPFLSLFCPWRQIFQFQKIIDYKTTNIDFSAKECIYIRVLKHFWAPFQHITLYGIHTIRTSWKSPKVPVFFLFSTVRILHHFSASSN